MSRVRCKFMGARPLKDGSLTGMLVFENITTADRHALIDLEGTVYLTNEEPCKVGEDNFLMIQKQLLYNFEKIVDVMVELGIVKSNFISQEEKNVS